MGNKFQFFHHIWFYRKIEVDNGNAKLIFWIQTPNLLGTLNRADVAWNHNYTSLFSYCLWKCNSDLKIINIKLVDINKKYVKFFYFLSISYFYNCFRESVRLIHGMSKRFMLSFSKDLGHINLINFEWLYDHDIDPLDPFKVCVFLCSDKIHLQNVAITSLHAPQTESHNSS